MAYKVASKVFIGAEYRHPNSKLLALEGERSVLKPRFPLGLAESSFRVGVSKLLE